ncbi:MAG: hypothetical protein KAI29_07345, partial [Cyclobacteriaceae bacterium]|nr:hypothetical protein [Cyclobacteriaceae bacterium]
PPSSSLLAGRIAITCEILIYSMLITELTLNYFSVIDLCILNAVKNTCCPTFCFGTAHHHYVIPEVT